MQEGNKTLLGAIVAIAVLVLVGIGVFTMTRSDNEETTETQEIVSNETEQQTQNQQDIIELALATPSLSTLVAAVQTAELVETLQGSGPFTVLAPTDDAFASALEALGISAEELLASDNLADILTYHVISGSVLSSQLRDGQVVETVQGGTLTVDITSAGVFFVDANGGRAQVMTPDVTASNGVVHVIDAVLLP